MQAEAAETHPTAAPIEAFAEKTVERTSRRSRSASGSTNRPLSVMLALSRSQPSYGTRAPSKVTRA
jgi:hypothetical protein